MKSNTCQNENIELLPVLWGISEGHDVVCHNVTREQIHVVVSNIEAKRIEEEEERVCLLGSVLSLDSCPRCGASGASGASQTTDRLIVGGPDKKVDESDLLRNCEFCKPCWIPMNRRF